MSYSYKYIKTGRSLLCLAVFLALGLSSIFAQARDSRNENENAAVWIIPVKGDIDSSLATFVRREGLKAASNGAGYIIFEIDTFGGRVDSALRITSFIMSIKDAKTVAWITNSSESMGVSWSAGALIALSCREIYMANGTSIGAAAPVMLSPTGESSSAGEKSVSAVRSQMAAIAERNGHPTGIALAMVDQDVELWEITVNGVTRAATLSETERLERESTNRVERIGIISHQNKLLSLTAQEALAYGLAKGIADDTETLLETLGAMEEAVYSVPSLADSIVSLLVSGPVQTLLIIIGLVMIFLEIQSPGFGIPGICAIIAFILVFGSNALLGTVGSLEMILFLLGIGLLAVEIFILPGFGVVGISGIILIGISLILSMQDFVIPSFEWEWTLMGRNTLVVFIGLFASIVGIAILALMGPKIHIFDRLMLKTQITETSSGPENAIAESEAVSGNEALNGKTGVVISTLRPSGRIEINGEVYSAEADGTFIEEGRNIKVIRVRGNTITVRPV